MPAPRTETGINTIAEPIWVNTAGVLVMADAGQPYLHVGFNSPVEAGPGGDGGDGGHDGAGAARERDRPVRRRRRWAVGVQNFFRELLPLGDRRHLGHGRAGAPGGACGGGLYGWLFGVAGGAGAAETAVGDGKLRIQARGSYVCDAIDHPLREWRGGDGRRRGAAPPPSLEVVLSVHGDVRAATRAALATLPKPARAVDTTMISDPIFTTWANFHWAIDEDKVVSFARDIAARGLSRSVMEVRAAHRRGRARVGARGVLTEAAASPLARRRLTTSGRAGTATSSSTPRGSRTRRRWSTGCTASGSA